MVEAVALRQLLHEPEPRELVEHPLQVEHADLVGDTPGDRLGMRGVLRAEQVGGLPGTDAGLVDRASEHQRDLVEELVAVRQAIGGADGPEPEGAPVVHHELQAAVGAGGARLFAEDALGTDAVLPRVGGTALVSGALPTPDRQRVLGCPAVAGELFGVQCPQRVDAARQRFELGDLPVVERPEERLAPLADPLEAGRLLRLRGLVLAVGHAGVGQQEVVDGAGGALRGAGRRIVARVAAVHVGAAAARPGRRRDALGRVVEPQLGLALLLEEHGSRKHLAPSADQGVAAGELIAEPGDVSAGVDAVQPQRDFGQLAGDRIEVHPVHVAVGDVVLHVLQLVRVLGVRDPLADLALLALQVLLGELAHSLVQECR